jgi:hypothetical protein
MLPPIIDAALSEPLMNLLPYPLESATGMWWEELTNIQNAHAK